MMGLDAPLDDFFRSLRDHLDRFVRPMPALDYDAELLAKAFSDINAAFLSKIWFGAPMGTLPQALLSDLVLGAIAQSSGALAFTAAQYMGACRRIQLSTNATLASRVGAGVKARHMTIGIGTTHLKPGPCVLNARNADGGFLLEGSVPWVSGHGIFSHILVAARVGSNGSVVALLDFPKDGGSRGGQIEVSAPFDLVAMNSTRTVSINLKNYFVGEQDIAAYVPDSETPPPAPLPAFYGFQVGCARAALALARTNLGKYRNAAMAGHLQALDDEVERCAAECRQIFYLTERQEIMERTVKARTWMDSILMRSIHAALPLIGGRAIFKGSEISRLVGEATVYAISLQNEDIIASKLESLVSS